MKLSKRLQQVGATGYTGMKTQPQTIKEVSRDCFCMVSDAFRIAVRRASSVRGSG
jgi:hypothetical protein